ncbi:MAG: quinolinate synthase NadA [Deltaproteobacteria bacterium]|nr:quinolinate synthase NadA [Deltaproteobacteria bacterium]
MHRRISVAKSKLGRKLVILGHHYQREEVIKFADFLGDSYGLSKIASEQKEADFIVFCGVHFMAEAAKILARPNQRVFHPDLTAGCPMADMAELDDVETAWIELAKITDIKKVIPIAYMNTTAELKAFCGANGGLICTSSNAQSAFDWAFARGEKIFFFPDEHLGRNTARKKGIEREKISIWNNVACHCEPEKGEAISRTQLNSEDCFAPLAMTKILLWPGFCHVHTYFTAMHVKEARKKYPDCKIIVHPECREDVVLASDENASTEGICKFVAAAPQGATIVVGTEINLVSRLVHENPDKNVVPLARSLCPNMFKISLQDICWMVESLAKGEYVNEVIVPNDVSKSARIALDRMLTV